MRQQFGRIFVKKSLVRSTGTYQFYVQATDKVGSGCSKNASVVVKVMPSANAPPVWVIPPIDNMTIYVLEVKCTLLIIFNSEI